MNRLGQSVHRNLGRLLAVTLMALAHQPIISQELESGSGEPFGAAGSRQGSFLETDSAIGTISIGVSGLSESERRQATTGDLEFGYLRLYELDEMFPRVIEIRPFALNRFETNEDSTYQSLGLGAGIRLSLREKYNKNYWYIRSSVLTPSEYYNDVYNTDRELSSIFEVFVGIEVPFNDPRTDRDIRQRTLMPTPIVVRAVPMLFDPAASADLQPEALATIRATIIAGYLDAVLSDYLTGRFVADIVLRNPWDVFRLMQRLTSIQISELDEHVLFEGRIDGEDGAAYRRAELRRLLRQGLTELMRGPYPLLLSPNTTQPAAGSDGSQDSPRQTATLISRPGMTHGQGSAGPLDTDAMIDAYIERFMAAHVR